MIIGYGSSNLPVGILLFSGFWQALPHWVRRWVHDGWDALLLMPVVAGLVLFGLWLDDPLESWLFGGDMPGWLTNTMGIDFDQRNALVMPALTLLRSDSIAGSSQSF